MAIIKNIFGLKSGNKTAVHGSRSQNKTITSGGSVLKVKLLQQETPEFGSNLQKLRHSLKSINLNERPKKSKRYIDI